MTPPNRHTGTSASQPRPSPALKPSQGFSPSSSETGSPTRSRQRSLVAHLDLPGQWKAFRQWMYQEEDPWAPCIMTLDGGGIRGFSSAIIIKRLMHEVYILEHELEEREPTGEQLPDSEDKLLPCHYFDFIYGTSTGGLIAVMLARLRMTIGDCLAQYRKVGNLLFGHRRTIIPLMTKYRSQPLVDAVKALVDECGLGNMHPWDLPVRLNSSEPPESEPILGASFTDEPLSMSGTITRNDSFLLGSGHFEPGSPFQWDPNAPRLCHSCCLTAIHNGDVIRAHLLRSYPHSPLNMPGITAYNPGADPLEIWQVTRATSAAPFYFDMLEAEVDGVMRGHKDGGIRENNPSGAAWVEFRTLYPTRDAPALLLSIGTGRTVTQPDGFVSTLPWPLGSLPYLRKIFENFGVVKNLLVKYTESERQHQQMASYARGESQWYKRLNVAEGLDNMPLDSWKKGEYHSEVVPGGASLTRMEDATEKYLRRDVDYNVETFVAPKFLLRHSAEKLVRMRRARRALGGPRWEYFIGKGLEERMARQMAQVSEGHNALDAAAS